ncbi:MAG: hypothetical protein KJO38_02970, partial [Gammaproteobacteria bacterium]|nr:hypothetical protein [Gammaproteobacteria bacterium]
MKLRYPLILLIALLPRLLLAEGFSTPDALLAEKAALESGPCDLDCNLKIADMYSAAYLEALRSAVMPGLRNEEYGQENTMLLFGEKIPASELDAMSAQEFLARQLLY